MINDKIEKYLLLFMHQKSIGKYTICKVRVALSLKLAKFTNGWTWKFTSWFTKGENVTDEMGEHELEKSCGISAANGKENSTQFDS